MASPAAIRRRNELRAIAAETKKILPSIVSDLESQDLTHSTIHNLKDLQPLRPEDCPGYTSTQSLTSPSNPENEAETKDTESENEEPETIESIQKGTPIRVLNADTFDAALSLQTSTAHSAPVAILNLASEKHPGGGWENGALAQEEALCFRSSLSLTLHRTYYPIPPLSALYSPSVVVIRESMSKGHGLLYPGTAAGELPVTSVISVAGLRRPRVKDGEYENPDDRNVVKGKIRTVLRIAAKNRHSKLVLGALGCGVFGNPPEQVARCFLEVFGEEEFRGGWWEEVVFAVLDNAREGQGGKDGSGNFGVFYRALEGVVV